MGTHTLPDIYALARAWSDIYALAQGQVCIYQRQSTSAHDITMFYFKKSTEKNFIVIPFSYIGNQISCDFEIKFCNQNHHNCGIQYY